jgi:RNA polymerase sigma-70 factor, ECF subfamily
VADSVIDPRGPGQGAAVKSAQPRPARALHADEQTLPSPADFDELVQLHLDFVWRSLRRLGLSASDADDASQQVFMIAARQLTEIPPGKERAFLYGTARRIAANARRDQRRRREVPAELAEELQELGALPDERLELERAATLLDDMLEHLPEELRRVLILAELEEVTVPAIAQLEAIPVGTAASRLRRARAAFEKLLERLANRNPFGSGSP